MAVTALKSAPSSASVHSARQDDAVTADSEPVSDPSPVRLRVAIAAEQLHAIGETIDGAKMIEVVGTVLDYEAPRESNNKFTLEAGTAIVIELHRDEREESLRSSGSDSESMIEHLTPREREVLELVAEGMSNRAIAERLGNSEHTVKFQVSSLLGKLGAATRAELVAIAIRRGLIMI